MQMSTLIRFSALAVLSCALAGCTATGARDGVAGSPSKELASIIQSVNKLSREGGAKDTPETLAGQHANRAKLGELIDGGMLNENESLVARYARANATMDLAYRERSPGEAPRREWVAQANEDMSLFIARQKQDYRPYSIVLSVALYRAAGIAEELEDEPRANLLYRQCADMGDAACQNNVGHTKQYGRFGQSIDLDEALKYHLRAFASGTAWSCAGAFSANSIAGMVHFQAVAAPNGDDLTWLERALWLAREVSADFRTPSACRLTYMLLDQYLLNLARGRERPELLREALAKTDPKNREHNALLHYIAGTGDKRTFEELIFKMNKYSQRCGVLFNAFYHATLTGKRDDARRYRSFIEAHANDWCRSQNIRASKIK